MTRIYTLFNLQRKIYHINICGTRGDMRHSSNWYCSKTRSTCYFCWQNARDYSSYYRQDLLSGKYPEQVFGCRSSLSDNQSGDNLVQESGTKAEEDPILEIVHLLHPKNITDVLKTMPRCVVHLAPGMILRVRTIGLEIPSRSIRIILKDEVEASEIDIHFGTTRSVPREFFFNAAYSLDPISSWDKR